MTATEPRDHAVFAYFTSKDEVDGEQVRFARSDGTDLLHWQELGGGRPVLVSTVGTGGVRDPFLIRAAGLEGEAAGFYLIATDLRIRGMDPDTAWTDAQTRGSRSIVVWESDDLLSWSEPRLAEVAPKEVGSAWAPEAIFDIESQRYFVFWASSVPDPEGGAGYNRMLACWTRDFREFTTPFVWVDPGWSVIDATVAEHDGQFYRVIKDERSSSSELPSAKFLTLEKSAQLDATHYQLVQDGIGSGSPEHGDALKHGEGPILTWDQALHRWILFIDEFTLRGYVPFESPTLDPGHWTMSHDYRLPAGASHGSILSLTGAEWGRLREIPAAE
ncbi:MAG: glycoside hydrolase family 43 protein [Pseudolysinimonas sp.]